MTHKEVMLSCGCSTVDSRLLRICALHFNWAVSITHAVRADCVQFMEKAAQNAEPLQPGLAMIYRSVASGFLAHMKSLSELDTERVKAFDQEKENENL